MSPTIPQILGDSEQEIIIQDDDADDDDGPTNEQNALFAKGPDTPTAVADLESPIKRVYYINPYGQASSTMQHARSKALTISSRRKSFRNPIRSS